MRHYQTFLILGGFLLVILLPCLLLTLFSINALKNEELLYQRRLELRYKNLFRRWNDQIHSFLIQEEKRLIQKFLAMQPPWQKDWEKTFSSFQEILRSYSFLEYPILLGPKGERIFPQKKRAIQPTKGRAMEINEILSTPKWYEEKKKYEYSLQEYKRLIALYRHQKDIVLRALLGIGRCYFALGNDSKALEYFYNIQKQYPLETADSINPLVYQAIKGMAQVYEKTNNPLRAHEIYVRLYQFLVVYREVLGKIFPEEKEVLKEKILKTRSQATGASIIDLKKLEEWEVAENRKKQFSMVFYQRFLPFLWNRVRYGKTPHGREENPLYLLAHLNITLGHLKASTGKEEFSFCYFVFSKEGNRWILGAFLQPQSMVKTFLTPKIAELQEDKEVRVLIHYGKSNPRKDLVCEQSLPYPLENIHLVSVLRDQKLFHHLSNLRVKNYIFAITVALVLIGVGTIGISYFLFREIQLAQMKSDFVSNVTHELKTPLTSIRMFVETILMGRVKNREEERECLQIIEKETARLTHLIEKILEFSSLENQIKNFKFTRCHLDEMIEESIQLFKKQIGPHPCQIEWKTIQKVQPIRGDRESLKEVLLNLFANAFKYCEDIPKITVDLKESKKYVILEVSDNGIGIPKKQWKKIFQKFYRVHNLLTSNKEGTGLGLAICKSIIQAHRGKIMVQSRLGEGSKFTILLPKPKGGL